jgi:methyl-accepting chemotaxis protein
MTPDWVITGLFSTALGIVGFYLNDLIKSKRSKKQDDATLNKTQAEFSKIYTDSQFLHIQLTDKLEQLVNEKTEKLQDILVKREMEHAEQVDYYIKKLAEEIKQKEAFAKELGEAMKEIQQLKKRVQELENLNGK